MNVTAEQPVPTALHVLISGDVQGVSFRARCEQQARAEELSGWVRNLEDGRVEAVFAGEEGAVNALADWCRTGPEQARVESLEITPWAQDLPTGPFGQLPDASAPASVLGDDPAELA